MGAKHPPGYDARRRRLERYAAAALKAAHPDEWAEAWAEGEQLERLRDALKPSGGGQRRAGDTLRVPPRTLTMSATVTTVTVDSSGVWMHT